MRPAGLLPNIAKLVPPWGRPKIARNADPFMKGNPNQVEAANLSHQPIANRVFRHLRREGAKHPIPDDEDAGIIAVKIARVGRVMDAVVAGRVHHCFKPARKTIHHFGMNPELVNQVYRTTEKHHGRMKADQHQRQAKDKADRDKTRPCLPQRGGEVVMLAAMVVDMARPEPTHPMGRAVKGIIGQIIQHKAQAPGPPGKRNTRQPKVISRNRHRIDATCHNQAGHRAAKAHGERNERVFRLIFFGRAALGPNHFQNDQQHKGRNRKINRVGKCRRHDGNRLKAEAQTGASSPRFRVIGRTPISCVSRIRKF